MKTMVTGAVVLGALALAVPAEAAPGQCSMTGYDTFACELAVDGGGISFTLPDGKTFVFAQVENGAGLGYLIAATPKPGRNPDELGAFKPVEGEAGCWADEKDDLKFCAALTQ